MERKNPECVLYHHSREYHAIDDKYDYGHCLKCGCNKYKEI